MYSSQLAQPAWPAQSGRSGPSLRVVLALISSLSSLSGWRALLLDLLLLLAAMLPLLWPLSAPGYLQGADAVDHPWRSLVIGEALRNGVLYPRWSPEFFNSWGYPFFNFYSPLSFYPAALLEMWLPIDLLDATKVAFAAYLAAAGAGAYVLARCVAGNRSGAILAGVLYVYSPYVASEVYVRSNLAGLAGVALLPFVLLVFVLLSRRPSLLLAGAGAVLMAVLVPSHNVTSLVTAGMVALLVLLAYWKTRNARALLLAGLALALGIGMASFFWAPALGEKSLVNTEKLYSWDFHYGVHFVDPVGPVDDLIHTAGRWHEPYRLTAAGPLDLHLVYPYGPPPYKLSLLQGFLLALGMAALAFGRTRPFFVVVFLLLALLLGFLHLSWSRLLWETVPMLDTVQFPWRLTGPVGLCLALVGAWALSSRLPSWRPIAMLAVGVAAAVSSMGMLPTGLGPFDGGPEVTIKGLNAWEYHARNRYGTMVDSQFMPLSIKWQNMDQWHIVELYDESYTAEGWVGEMVWMEPGSQAWVLATRHGHQWAEAVVDAASPTVVSFHTVYFPGWVAYVDGERADVTPSGRVEYESGWRAWLGVAEVQVPAGQHLVRLEFQDTPLRRWAGWASLASLAALGMVVGAGLVQRRRQGGSVGVLVGVLAAVMMAGGLIAWWGSVPRGTEWVENRLVVDLVQEAEARRLEIGVPAGGKPDDYVHPRDFVIDGQARDVLYMHPPGMVTRRVWVPEGAVLEFGMGVDPEVWDRNEDGVEFVVELRTGGEETRLFSAYLDPRANPADRRWADGEVDLGSYARQEVDLVLRTLPGGSGDLDWAGWATPRIVLR